MTRTMKDLAGQRFGRLEVESFSHRDTHRNIYWNCRCDCGGHSTTSGSALRSGHTVSCGCAQRDAAKKLAEDALLQHGHGRAGKQSPTYIVWKSARQRCNNPNRPDYHLYGGRGIEMRFATVTDLIADIGERPDGMSLDRINNDGHYDPGNVRWATAKEQARNRRPPTRGYA